MTTTPNRTVILGAGHAGSQCAVSLRAAGYLGEIHLFDDDSAALPYHKPPLSKKYLLADEPRATPLRSGSAYDKAEVTRRQVRVESIDTDNRLIRLDDGERVAFSQLVLATGALNRELASLHELCNVHSLRTLQDAAELRKAVAGCESVTVLGGGFIGLELAACLSTLGKPITVLEAAERVLARVASPEVSSRVEAYLAGLGVSVHTGAMATEFHRHNDRVASIDLQNGQTLPVDLLIVGIGAVANTALASEAGLSCDNGVCVSASLQTECPGIYAIGDCASYPHWQSTGRVRLESVQNAVEQGKFVAAAIASGQSDGYRNVPWFWSDVGELKLQIAGILDGAAERVVRQDEHHLAVYHVMDQRVLCVESVNSPKDHMLARKLVDSSCEVTASDIARGPEHLKVLLAGSE